MVLSIIIPCYNAEPYIHELLDTLAPQITDEVEVILVDDGSDKPIKTKHKYVKVIRKHNGGCATARNRGLDEAAGDYIQFLDADDLVPEYFIKRLLLKIEESAADVIDFSWKSLSKEGNQHNYVLRSDKEYLPNPSVCTRCFKRSFIGDVRFNEQKDSTEDEDFSRKIGYLDRSSGYKHASITEYMYFYRTAVTDSKIKRFKKGIMRTKRVTYYYNHVTADMTNLLEEIKKEDELNEVWLLTNQCDIPELKRYCQVHAPMSIWTHYLRGEPYNRCTIMPVPIRTQVVMYCEYCNKVGGISTFMYEWAKLMRGHVDFIILYDNMDDAQVERIRQQGTIMRNDPKKVIYCDTIVLNRLTDKVPGNIIHKKSVQVCHCCHQKTLRVPKDKDFIINVSKAAKESWGTEAAAGQVIHNPCQPEPKRSLFLVSATRIGARDKGSNDERFIKLAKMLQAAAIQYVWLNFSDYPLKNAPEGIINMGARTDVQDFIARADYLVQLSDVEAYSYATLEALCNNTPVICTDVPSFREQGIKDGVNGYILPFDMNFDVKKLLNVPKFNFKYNNDRILQQWMTLLAKKKPKPKQPKECKETKPEGRTYHIRALSKFWDIRLKAWKYPGDVWEVSEERMRDLLNKGLAEVV